MNSQQIYDVCMRLTKQYEILQEEAKKIRSSRYTPFETSAATDQYKLNQKAMDRTENLMIQICASPKYPVYNNYRNPDAPQIPTFEYHHDISNPNREIYTYTFKGIKDIIDEIGKL